jgi:hypothetical protein
MSADPKPVSRWFKWEIVILLWFAFFLNQADRQIFGVTLPLIRAEFHLTDQQMGLVATTFSIVFGLLVPIAGLAGDIFKRRDVVVLSLLIFSVGTLLTGTSSSFLFLLLFRGVATGAGEAFYAPAANSLIADHHVETRARALDPPDRQLYRRGAGQPVRRLGRRPARLARRLRDLRRRGPDLGRRDPVARQGARQGRRERETEPGRTGQAGRRGPGRAGQEPVACWARPWASAAWCSCWSAT